MTPCYFQPFAETPCDGPLTRAHVISQRVLKREHALANPRSPAAWFIPTPLTGTNLQALLDDERNWRPGCWKHHFQADQLVVDYDPPASAYDFASELGLDHYLPIREAAA